MGLICLDLDDTLIAGALVEVETPTGTKLQRRQHELYTEPVLAPRRHEILKRVAEEGDRFAIVTNQSGVAWGFHTQAEVYRRIASTIGLLECFWGQPFSVHVAFMHPRATLPQFKGDDGRKPSGQMIWQAREAHGLLDFDPAAGHAPDTIMVGDRDEDRGAAETAGVDFVPAESFFAE